MMKINILWKMSSILVLTLFLHACDDSIDVNFSSSNQSSSSQSSVSSSISSSSQASSSSPSAIQHTNWTDNLDNHDGTLWRQFDNFTWGNNLSYMKAYNIEYSNGMMLLNFLKGDTNGPFEGGRTNSCSEIASVDGYSYRYGKFSVRMKAAKAGSIVSSFFLFRYDPWQEIDIEFVGTNTSSIFINVFSNPGNEGDANNLGFEYHRQFIPLGFDASFDFHVYTIEWTNGSIKWYADSNLLYTGTTNVPNLPMEISMNIWHVNYEVWAGALFTNTPNRRIAYYDWIKFEN